MRVWVRSRFGTGRGPLLNPDRPSLLSWSLAKLQRLAKGLPPPCLTEPLAARAAGRASRAHLACGSLEGVRTGLKPSLG